LKKIHEFQRSEIDFPEHPLSYFSKHKDGSDHHFIFMKQVFTAMDPKFHPYLLEKAIESDLGNDYYTMSSNSVTHFFPDGTNETISMDQWVLETSIFNSISSLKIFRFNHHQKNFNL
jgi:hypothetical protein